MVTTSTHPSYTSDLDDQWPTQRKWRNPKRHGVKNIGNVDFDPATRGGIQSRWSAAKRIQLICKSSGVVASVPDRAEAEAPRNHWAKRIRIRQHPSIGFSFL